MNRILRAGLLAAFLVGSLSDALAQGTVLQGGPVGPGRVPMYSSPATSQPIVIDSGPASGGPAGVGLAELGITARGVGTPPYVAQGSGPFGTNACLYDAPVTNAAGYHYLCFSANAQGGGLLAYGAGGAATQLPFSFNINGVAYQFPFSATGSCGGVFASGELCANAGSASAFPANVALTSFLDRVFGATPNQTIYRSSSAWQALSFPITPQFGGTGAANNPANILTWSGAFPATFTLTGPTAVTFPTSGTLATNGAPIVILATGQSNFTMSPALAWSPAANAVVWNFSGADGNIGTAYVPLSSTTMNVTQKYASDVAKANPSRTVYLINISFSAQPISHWLPGTSAPDVFANILANITPALAAAGVSQINNMIWWQGESDAAAPTSYVSNFNTVITRFQAQTISGVQWFPVNTPVVVFGVTSSTFGGSAIYGAMNDYLQAAVNSAPDTRMFTYPASLGASYWTTIHMTAAGYDLAGTLAANNFLYGPQRKTLPSAFVDAETGFIAVGAAIPPDSLLTLNRNTGASAAVSSPPPTAHMVGADGGLNVIHLDSYGNQNGILCRRANGTQSTPTALALNDFLCNFAVVGHDGAAYSALGNGVIGIRAANIWSVSDHSTFIEVQLTPVGSTTLNALGTGVRFNPSGGLTVGDAIDSTVGTIRALNGFVVGATAKTLTLKQGANGAVGTFICTSGGSITVNNTFVAITDTIIISLNTAGGTVSNAPALNAITAATSFVAKCATSDTSTYNYAIIKNAS